jgi:hypothetical protein
LDAAFGAWHGQRSLQRFWRAWVAWWNLGISVIFNRKNGDFTREMSDIPWRYQEIGSILSFLYIFIE